MLKFISCFILSLDFVMSVDKFGRFLSSSKSSTTQGIKGPKGEGFNLTKAGDYDIQFKRICNVGVPKENEDAVNLKTFKDSLAKCLSLSDKNLYDANGARLCNVGEPTNDMDVINKMYFTSNAPVKLKDSYSFHQSRLQDIAAPISDGDAVNLKTFNNNALSIDKGHFNAKGLKITNVHDPKTGQDCVNLRYLQASSLVSKDHKEYDAKGRIIKNLALPKNKSDAINYAYLSEVLAEMSFSIYSNLKKKGTQKITKEDWKKKVTKSLTTCDWGELFGISENSLVQPINDAPVSPVINTSETLGIDH